MIEMELDHMDKLYYSKNPLVRYIHTKRLEIIKKIVENYKLKNYNKEKMLDNILDCGCGEGHLLKKLQGRKYGIDLSDTAIKRAKEKNPDAKFLKSNILDLPFEDNFFDIVICSEVLEHIKDYKSAVSEIKRVVKKRGRIIITVPNEKNWTIGRLMLLRFPIKIEDHVNSFTPLKIIELFGFEPNLVVHIPFNLFSLSLTQIYEFEKRDLK